MKSLYPSSFWIKVHGGPYQQGGIPDLIGCVNGYFIGLEVKLPGKEDTLTDRQAATLTQIGDALGIQGMVTSVEQAIELVAHATVD